MPPRSSVAAAPRALVVDVVHTQVTKQAFKLTHNTQHFLGCYCTRDFFPTMTVHSAQSESRLSDVSVSTLALIQSVIPPQPRVHCHRAQGRSSPFIPFSLIKLCVIFVISMPQTQRRENFTQVEGAVYSPGSFDVRGSGARRRPGSEFRVSRAPRSAHIMNHAELQIQASAPPAARLSTKWAGLASSAGRS